MERHNPMLKQDERHRRYKKKKKKKKKVKSTILTRFSTTQKSKIIDNKNIPTITIIIDLNSNCQLPKQGDRRNYNTNKTCLKCRINGERPTGKKHATVGWDDGGKIGKMIN